MKKIAVITRDEDHCGIFGYTMSALQILQASTTYEYKLYPCALEFNQPDAVYVDWLNSIDADAFLYNFCPITMPWLLPSVLKAVNKPHFVISGHDVIWIDGNDWATHIKDRKVPAHVYNVDPTWQGWFGVFTQPDNRLVLSPRQVNPDDIVYTTPNYTVLPRPIVSYAELQYAPPGEVIRIATFGISQVWKNYDKIVQRVCADFPDQPVHLTIRATQGNWVQDNKPHDNGAGNALAEQAKSMASSNVTVEVVHDFLPTHKEIAAWLNTYDLILFMYEPNWNRFAVSSSLDHALAAKKPVAVNHSKMFSHVSHIPEIYIENKSLKEIMAQGIEPLKPLYEQWSNDNFIQAIETPMRKIL